MRQQGLIKNKEQCTIAYRRAIEMIDEEIIVCAVNEMENGLEKHKDCF